MARKPTCLCGSCRKCRRRAYVREWIRRHPEQNRDRARRWREQNAARIAASRPEHTEEDRIKWRARRAVQRAVANGTLIRGPCERCGAEPAEAHHKDYARPLDVEWLCASCHKFEHSPHD